MRILEKPQNHFQTSSHDEKKTHLAINNFLCFKAFPLLLIPRARQLLAFPISLNYIYIGTFIREDYSVFLSTKIRIHPEHLPSIYTHANTHFLSPFLHARTHTPLSISIIYLVSWPLLHCHYSYIFLRPSFFATTTYSSRDSLNMKVDKKMRYHFGSFTHFL